MYTYMYMYMYSTVQYMYSRRGTQLMCDNSKRMMQPHSQSGGVVRGVADLQACSGSS